MIGKTPLEAFLSTFYYTIKAHWPDVKEDDTNREAIDYVGVPFGTSGYDWSPGAARELAYAFMNEHGELS